MDIYTGRGDEGQTDLQTMDRISKASPRIEAYGTVDELNAFLGSTRPAPYDDLEDRLREIQNHLHIVQADFANPDLDAECPRIDPDHISQLEDWIDEYDSDLEPLTSFILPSGGDLGSRLHHGRTICRRAERRAVALSNEADINDHAVTYLNRLSDALFVFARLANARDDVSEEEPTY
ncbi:cob(I)yrinic acid a,c-diamide adenosyltransferase [Halobacteria archaeon AArc-dxtr1]|nr:cob(I)yrinic acid a,c-diamide adenosyltransferase [Halobacteria archaeon AArc-dxtr1]